MKQQGLAMEHEMFQVVPILELRGADMHKGLKRKNY